MVTTTLARTKSLAQFNKLNKVFITVLGMVEDIALLNHDHYLYREIMIDEANEKVVGNYDSYQIVPIAEQPTEILEDQLNILARQKIISEYPVARQLNVISELLERMADSAGIECEALKTMNDYIREVRQANLLRKGFYESDPDYQYISNEKFEQLEALKLEGGIADYGSAVTNL